MIFNLDIWHAGSPWHYLGHYIYVKFDCQGYGLMFKVIGGECSFFGYRCTLRGDVCKCILSQQEGSTKRAHTI